jgi:protoheme IX farnesyltransferase
VNFLIALATGAGFYLGGPAYVNAFPVMRLVHTVLATLLLASGAAALNQVVERDFDAQMRRTARRPVATGRLDPAAVLRFGAVLTLVGALYLAAAVNTLASLLGVFTVTSYLGVYTPLKRKTPAVHAPRCVLGRNAPADRQRGRVPVGSERRHGPSTRSCSCGSFLTSWRLRGYIARTICARGIRFFRGVSGRNRFVAWQSVVPAMALIPLSLLPTLSRRCR